MTNEKRELFDWAPAASRAEEEAPARLEAYLPPGSQPVREIVLAPSITLQIIYGPGGPVLRISAPRIAVEAAEALELRGDTVRIDSRALVISADRMETVAGERLTTIAGADRLEAEVIEAQASGGALSLKAQGRLALDGEHIGLNDEACPRPFSWSRRAQELGHGE